MNVNGVNGVQAFTYENSVTGLIAGIEEDKVSKTILGTDGLYFVLVSESKLVEITESTSYIPEKEMLTVKGNNVDGLLQELIYQKADIDDNRRVIK